MWTTGWRRDSGREDLLGDGDGGHGLGPAGVEGQVGDGLDELGLGHAVVAGAAEVEAQLVGVTACHQHGDSDEAAVAGGELGAVPDVLEQDVVGDLGELGGEVADRAASSTDLAGLPGHGVRSCSPGGLAAGCGQWCWVAGAAAYCSSVTASSQVVGSDPSGLFSSS